MQDEVDGSNEYNNFKRSLNTTQQLIQDSENIDIVVHIGDINYASGFFSQWDNLQHSGNHERDLPGTESFYLNVDSGGECGVLAETMFCVPASNRAKFWYSSDYVMSRFCIADTEHDWREGTEQYKFMH